jgi:hypothetical protein
MSWIDKFFIGYQFVQNNGVTLPQEPYLDIIGATSVVDDPTNQRTKVTVSPFATTQVNVTASGAVTAQNGYEYFVNLTAAGGNVTFTTAGLTAGQSFSVYLIVGVGSSYTCTINPITAGSHIEALYPPGGGAAAPGTLTTSLVMTAIGEGVSLTTFDGVNLWNNLI